MMLVYVDPWIKENIPKFLPKFKIFDLIFQILPRTMSYAYVGIIKVMTKFVD